MQIALITGGYSGESVISYQTADTFLANWPNSYPTPILVDIRKDGWFARIEGAKIPVDKNDFSVLHGITKIKFDLAVIALHGAPGEDGKLQGYLEMLDIPYTTGDVLNMAATFNKKFTTSFLAQNGIACAQSLLLKKSANRNTALELVKNTLSLPLFVKPNASGSSLGISMVKSWNDLHDALEKAFAEDRQVIVENYLEGMEVSCGVAFIDEKVTALPPTEIVSHNEFFDFEAKYNKQSDEITPARLPEEDIANIQREAEKIYQLMNCQGIVRIDFKYLPKKPQVIEINTVPGMSAESIVPQQLREANIGFSDAIEGIIKQALAR